jgi:uncharacterized repeat protein (TIGR01451 family)
MLGSVKSFLSRQHPSVPAVGGFPRLVRLAASAGLVARIHRAKVCARDKTVSSSVFSVFSVLSFASVNFLGALMRFLLAVLCIQSPLLWAATPPSTPITNTASASYGAASALITVTGAVTVTTAARTPATITFLQYVPGTAGNATVQNVPTTACNPGSGFVPLPAPRPAGGSALAGNVPLAPATVYASGDPVFVRVVDYDQNQDSLVAETVVVTVSSNGVDSEVLRLTETGPSTGVFIGYVPSTSAPAQAGNCTLNVGANHKLLANYIDRSAGSIEAIAQALIDPLGVVFDSSTGLPVNGARVTLINAATGLPAAVFGNDGISSFPSTVVSGASVSDSGGQAYAFGPGRFQFPRAAVGTYRLQIVPPADYIAPSVVATPALQVLPNAPYFIVTGSRGEAFPVLAGPPIEIDVPLDPVATGGVQITKNADKAAVAIGEFVPYSVTITNRASTPIAALRVADRLPVGFRYQAGSARLNQAVLADPSVSGDGRTLEFNVGALAGNGALSLRYVAAVLAGTPVGQAENTVQAVGRVTSNVARASVLVREDLNRSRAILLGRVTQVESCDNTREDEQPGAAKEPRGLAGVRVLMQDGTYIVTDQEGRWHADNIRPGTHVVQLDETSLPKGVELQACEQNTRTGGRNFSQFVNLRGGTLWRADFRLKPVVSCLSQQIQVQGTSVRLQLASPVANQATSVTVMLPKGASVVPGSVKLDGQSFAQAELGDGFLVARLGAQAGRWQQVLSFELDAAPTADLALTVQVQPPGQPVQRLTPLVLKAPATEAAQCAPVALPVALPVAAAPAAAEAKPVAAPARAAEQLVEILPYDDKWVAAAAPGAEWLHPQSGFVPALPVIKVAVKHEARHQVELKVNGVLASALRYEGVVMNPAGTLAVSNWRALELRDGANVMEVTVRDLQGQVVLQEARTIHYAVGPATAVFDAKRSQLVADGRSAAVIAVRMLDKEGQPVRRGAGGELQVGAPYLSQDQANAIQREPLTGNLGGKARYQIGDDGVALIALQPTTQAGEVVLNFDFGNNRTQEVRAWLKPDLREWVLVGFAEGTKGFKRLSGNMESLQANGADDSLFDQNRIAFYAKGQVKGEYLLTLAYDSAKEKNSAGSKPGTQPLSPVLNQAIDPNQFYTLYGDATQPQFDAASAKKLYLKIEKSQFYAMFGDYETGLSVTELGRYSRTLNGFKSEFKGERVAYNAFASQTAQSFRKDEIQGDGTSGLYRLAGRDIVVNSDKVRIEVRDRFRPEIIVSSRSLTRYLDYQIDFALGTVFFREPIAARDTDFNPVFIVVDYESASQADAKLTYGGRVAVKIGSEPADKTAGKNADKNADKSEVGLTRIREGNVGREATLTAVDGTLALGEHTLVRAEIGTSQRNSALGQESGTARLLEVSHVDATLAARAYVRKQDAGFGLGQQPAAEAGTQKVGADARLQLSDTVQLQAEAYRLENQTNNAQRDVLEARGQWKNEALLSSAGVRVASESDGKGKDASVRQLTGGVAYEMLDKQLTLRASTEINVGGQGESLTFPNRLILGIDYKLNPQVALFAQQEFARSGELSADTTRVGLRTQPWSGGEVATSLGNQSATDSARLYGNLGLVQKLQLNEQWAADFGIDRSQTIHGSAASSASNFGAAQPLASGTANAAGNSSLGSAGAGGFSTTPGGSTSLLTGDYTAVYTGASYKNEDWSGNARIEWRASDADTRINLLLGAQRNLQEGRSAAAGLIYNRSSGSTDASRVDARLSYAYRPLNGELIWLDRLQYVHESSQGLAGRLLTRKLINNFNANWMPNRRSQIALQYGAKYVRDTIDSTSYKGFTELLGLEARQDIGESWDIGLHAGMLHAFGGGARDYQLGVSVGFKVSPNSWLSVGYNQLGFVDADFAGAEYRARGLYLNLRVKFDQDTFNLNGRDTAQSLNVSAKP